MEAGRGRAAEVRPKIPPLGWKAFCLLLALFPALTAFTSLYGFLADRSTIADNISILAGIRPNDSDSSSGFRWPCGARTMRQGHIRSFERRVRTERNPQLLEIESDCVRFYIRQHIVWNFLKYRL